MRAITSTGLVVEGGDRVKLRSGFVYPVVSVDEKEKFIKVTTLNGDVWRPLDEVIAVNPHLVKKGEPKMGNHREG